jgi:hypothetical protein
MEHCSICGQPLAGGMAAFPYTDAAGNAGRICEACRRRTEAGGAAQFEAVHRIYPAAKEEAPPEANSQAYDRPGQPQLDEDISRLEIPGYMSPSGYKATGRVPGPPDIGMPGSIWSTVLKVFAWVTFAGLIIAGFVIGIPLLDIGSIGLGILAIFGGFITAFLSVAWTMVFLDAALDISEIKLLLHSMRK